MNRNYEISDDGYSRTCRRCGALVGDSRQHDRFHGVFIQVVASVPAVPVEETPYERARQRIERLLKNAAEDENMAHDSHRHHAESRHVGEGSALTKVLAILKECFEDEIPKKDLTIS